MILLSGISVFGTLSSCGNYNIHNADNNSTIKASSYECRLNYGEDIATIMYIAPLDILKRGLIILKKAGEKGNAKKIEAIEKKIREEENKRNPELGYVYNDPCIIL